MTSSAESDWVNRFADEVVAEAQRRAPGKPIVCASGLSPSGPIHLGNLREVMTPHLVADEIRRRGHPCVHVLSWDDYDRFRKVPAGIDERWAEHIGKPLSSVPAPADSPHANWAEHYKAAMVAALRDLGIVVREVSQTAQYTSGAYRDRILLAMRERATIDGILGRYRTKVNAAAIHDTAQTAQGSAAATEDDGNAGTEFFPYKPYCSACERDSTTVTAYDDETAQLTYSCACGAGETVCLRQFDRGKLVWKVDWPMRWVYEGVVFEPSGVDHTSPGSSYVVGTEIARVFGGQAPIGPMYAFVGITGMAKMSSSKGGVPTPGDALKIMEAPLLRWLYARRRPNQGFKVAFDQEIHRLYDEWDALGQKVAAGTAPAVDGVVHDRACRTAETDLPRTPRPVAYRALASIADITTGDPTQMLRILRDLDPASPIEHLDEVRPRLDRAVHWVTEQLPVEQRTRVLARPDADILASLEDHQRRSLELLLDGLETHWSLAGLTTLVYGVPKVMLGLPLDATPSAELKEAQRGFFILLYRLLTGGETGPRLPTLLLAVGAERVRTLLTPPA